MKAFSLYIGKNISFLRSWGKFCYNEEDNALKGKKDDEISDDLLY